jgi:hypothetical protein
MAMMAVVAMAGAVVPSPAADKDSPLQIEGKWEAPARHAGKHDEIVQTIEFKGGRMVWVEPRQTGDKEKKTGFRIEAEYTVSKTGRVYGLIAVSGGSLKADEGDTFSFIPRLQDGVFRMGDMRGTAQLEQLAERTSFVRKR